MARTSKQGIDTWPDRERASRREGKGRARASFARGLACGVIAWLFAASVLGTIRLAAAASEDETADSEFDTHIAPLFARRCLSCHNASSRKGGLDLSHADAAREGGAGGVAIVANEPHESYLWQRVSSDEMP